MKKVVLIFSFLLFAATWASAQSCDPNACPPGCEPCTPDCCIKSCNTKTTGSLVDFMKSSFVANTLLASDKKGLNSVFLPAKFTTETSDKLVSLKESQEKKAKSKEVNKSTQSDCSRVCTKVCSTD